MYHDHRNWMVTDVEGGAHALAAELKRVQWTRCTGFRCDGIVWVNDSITEDSIQEYAVIRESDLVQLDSVTVDWCDTDKLAALQADYANGGGVEWWFTTKVDPTRLETQEEHRLVYCELCA